MDKKIEDIKLECVDIYWQLRQDHQSKEAKRLDTIIKKLDELEDILRSNQNDN